MQSITRKERAELERLFITMRENRKPSKYKAIYKNMIKKLVSKPPLPSRVQKA